MKKLLAPAVAAGLILGFVAGCASQPEKPAGYFQLRDECGREPERYVNYLDPEGAVLFGPHFSLAASWVVTQDSLSADDTRRLGLPDAQQGFRAADGHEFVMTCLGGAVTAEDGRWPRETDPELAASITIDGRTKKLAADPKPGTLILASVPKSGPAMLTITDEGRPLAMDLRTGRPTGDDYQILTMDVNESYEGTGQVNTPAGMRSLDVDITIDEITLEPYFPGLGWAKEGRGWLRVSVAQLGSDGVVGADSGVPVVGFFVDPGKTFVLDLDGTKARPRSGRLVNASNVGVASPTSAAYTAIFDVPESFRTGKLTITPDGPMFRYRGESYLSDYDLAKPPRCGRREVAVCLEWQRPPKPQVVEVALP
ncbi:hypothetical protein [Actinopolymorpha alba]|uniref:hypothetical protein n=1 Tax=Actinopolymorpha alba TaxID=533267 RepID=UPI000360B6CC|nr:hypothetical protein [Actinopolymorpha alba]